MGQLKNMEKIEAAQTELGQFLVSLMPVKWSKIYFYSESSVDHHMFWFLPQAVSSIAATANVSPVRLLLIFMFSSVSITARISHRFQSRHLRCHQHTREETSRFYQKVLHQYVILTVPDALPNTDC